MSKNEAREGIKVRHQWEHGRSFDGQEFTEGVIVDGGTRLTRAMGQIYVDFPGRGRELVRLADLVAA